MIITQDTIDKLLALVQRANKAIMDVYDNNAAIVEIKADNTPLTQADKASHHIITTCLAELFPEVPIISEEGNEQDNQAAVKSPAYWIIDPIDGTREFVNRTGEFCIAIGLVDGDKPSFGFVSAPTQDTIYYGGAAIGSFKKVGSGKPEPIHVATLDPHVVAVSRSHLNEATSNYVEQHYPTAERRPLGSMLKQMALAEGTVDIYPVLDQPLHLWDVAAGQAIIEGAGGSVKRFDGSNIHWHDVGIDFKIGDFIAKS